MPAKDVSLFLSLFAEKAACSEMCECKIAELILAILRCESAIISVGGNRLFDAIIENRLVADECFVSYKPISS